MRHDARMGTVSVRYIVDDVDAAIAFYRDDLGFEVEMHPAPAFAMLRRGDLRLLLSAPSGAGGGGQILPGSRRPSRAGGRATALRPGTPRATLAFLRHARGRT
jgi:catechol 2,3-dioxygenase-like lactoylglutathione lyase family enzyme